MFHLANTIQQQHVTSIRTTDISFISNGVRIQLISQQSSTTTVYPQSQPPPPTELLPTCPRSEKNPSIEGHDLEMKYHEGHQLAVAFECDRQSQTLNFLINVCHLELKNIYKYMIFLPIGILNKQY